ncbi:polysaccharide pyruvyl transferase family protein [Aromatoleum petrolei]|uniref:Polysaccharide pyruvyl transferase family protein n=1 Tax=Aromatoleum petrolei TaxID=76116 RepID=A0ABX1MPY1_9RHOO|nr:polysaccharide pyruvyl transferase family protein [Aromatoleum petrolei]NMF88376.1 polysaccharide pyruvyl transferase family protein [Aromatoleum petrolei]QTQ37206.1 Putative pyruvyl transferase [Aromatoleum petrolei]
MAIKLYWCRGKGRDDPGQRNFGDYLSPLIVEMAARKPVEYAPIDKADMMAIGSIMNREQKAKRFFLPRRLHVWGSGTDAPERVFSARHHYHAVRGRLTREQIEAGAGLKGVAQGDPGLLADRWWAGRPKPAKRFTLGFIPHYVDQAAPIVGHVGALPGVKVIDVYWPVEEVLRAVQECHFIVSSSMHGLIVSDAFGVPNRRIAISRGKISDYKFADYYSAFGIDEPACLSPEDILARVDGEFGALVGACGRPGIEAIKDNLLTVFPSL